jgi:hypothetical protein
VVEFSGSGSADAVAFNCNSSPRNPTNLTLFNFLKLFFAMNTENTATPPEAIPAPNIQAVDFTSEAKQLHRKIAKLPKPLRDLINSSLDDGLPAKEIIQKLEASTNPPLPYPISEVNISGWKSTGYMRYLAQQDHLDSIQASREAALEMVATNNLSLPQATLQVIASQCFQILGDFSPAAVKQKLADEPLKYISLLHVFARLTREMVHLEKYHEARAAAQAEAAAKNPLARPVSEDKKTEIVSGEMDRIFRRRDPRRAMAAQLLRASKAAPEPVSPPVGPSSTVSATEQHLPVANPVEGAPLSLASSDGEMAGLAGSFSSPIEIQKSKIENLPENCLQCGTPLPPLTSDGKRPHEHCPNCNILLPPPGCCTQPSDDQCFNCGAALPHRLPNGRRPVPSCHVCGAGLGRELDEDIKKYAEE